MGGSLSSPSGRVGTRWGLLTGSGYARKTADASRSSGTIPFRACLRDVSPKRRQSKLEKPGDFAVLDERMRTPLADGCAKFLGAIWGFTRPFERISRFWRIDFIPKPQKSACFENPVKSDSRRLQILCRQVLNRTLFVFPPASDGAGSRRHGASVEPLAESCASERAVRLSNSTRARGLSPEA